MVTLVSEFTQIFLFFYLFKVITYTCSRIAKENRKVTEIDFIIVAIAFMTLESVGWLW